MSVTLTSPLVSQEEISPVLAWPDPDLVSPPLDLAKSQLYSLVLFSHNSTSFFFFSHDFIPVLITFRSLLSYVLFYLFNYHVVPSKFWYIHQNLYQDVKQSAQGPLCPSFSMEKDSSQGQATANGEAGQKAAVVRVLSA